MLMPVQGDWQTIDMGLVHSSAAPSITQLIVERLVQSGDILDKGASPNFLARHWPPAFKEWSTKSARDAFFASPQFPRLLVADSIKDTIRRGVENGMLGYVGKKADGSYEPFRWKTSLLLDDVEISDDVFLITQEVAEAYVAGKSEPGSGAGGQADPKGTSGASSGDNGTTQPTGSPTGKVATPSSSIPRLIWSGDVPHQKWMNFYTKVLSKFSAGAGLKLTLRVEVAPTDGISPQKVEDTKSALRELGLKDSLED
jgi:hypothetical protein